MRVRVKICGITRPEDALIAARLGADAIGLVFHAHSPRKVTVAQALAIVTALPPFVATVGLFVDERPEVIRRVITALPLSMLQFHGDELEADCRGYGLPYIKAIRMRDGLDLMKAAAAYEGAAGLLLDAYKEGLPGGTGERFDWHALPAELPRPVILAGGLTPQNVVAAVRQVRPWAVDVSSGVETAPGIKDCHKILAFMKEMNSVRVA